MSVHREEATFVLRLELSAEFGEDYEGEDDGQAWLQAWHAKVQPRIVRAVFAELRAEPGYAAVPVSRGKHPDDEIEIAVTYRRASETMAQAAPTAKGARGAKRNG